MRLTLIFIAFIYSLNTATAQDYFLENNGPYVSNIQSPEELRKEVIRLRALFSGVR